MAITLKPLTVETQNLELRRDGYTWNNFCANFGDKLLFDIFYFDITYDQRVSDFILCEEYFAILL